MKLIVLNVLTIFCFCQQLFSQSIKDTICILQLNDVYVSTEFLFIGKEKGLEFLKEGNPEIKTVKRFDAPGDIHTDLRLAVVKYLSGLEEK